MRTHRWTVILFAAAALAATLFLAGGSGRPAFASSPSVPGREGYYRFPAIHGDLVVFTSEGDLWSVPAVGGIARRLTSHQGVESEAAISPDGSTIAFSAQYDGPTEVYAMPVEGGLPVRRTFSGQPLSLVGWTPDSKIITAMTKYSGLPDVQLVLVDPGRGENVIPLSQAASGAFAPDGKTLYFTRLPRQPSFTKRYKGGTAENIWKYTLGGAAEAVPLTTDYAGTSKDPMVWNGRIYFLSDRDGIMNLWSMDFNGRGLEQHTFHKEFDASSPSLSDGRIVYQLVSDLHLYDIATAKDSRIEIKIPSDFDQMREKWISKPLESMTQEKMTGMPGAGSAHLSPSGDKIALVSRGRVFIAPAAQGRLVRIDLKGGVRRRSARFMPDGKSVVFLSDESGEWEFRRFSADGTGEGVELTSGAKIIRFDGLPSPDGRRIAFADKDNQLWVHDIESKSSKRIAVSESWDMPTDLAWSYDGRSLAFARGAKNFFSQILLYDTTSGETTALTDDRVESYAPAWSRDGKWLYFLSDRFFQSVVPSPFGPNQPEPYFDKKTKIYAISLTAKERFPFAPADELQPEAKEPAAKPQAAGAPSAAAEKPAAKPEKPAVAEVKIDLAGIQSRVFEVPVPAGTYGSLALNDKLIFVTDSEGLAAGRPMVKTIEIGARAAQAKTLLEGIQSFELSADGKKILFQRGPELFVIDAGPAAPPNLNDKKVDLSHWTFPVDPREEWRQIYFDAWRMERDYFYDRNLHNVDYEGLLARYRPFVERVSDRDELNDLLGHLVGELSALHTFVAGGDLRRGTEAVFPGSLGARLVRDEPAGGYKIEHIYKSDPDDLDVGSPLAKPMLGIAEGDVLLAINGVRTLDAADPSLLLRNTAGTQVLLEIKPAGGGPSFKSVVVPISPRAEADLRYSEWEYTRRLETDQLGKGDIGYVHLRAMGGPDYTAWVKNFYPVFDRKGLIIDVRHNRGGNIDAWILEKLLRKAWFFWQPRVGGPMWNMQQAFRGHMVVLCNEYTASDGEAFSEGFKRLGLGKVIGTRTWGGEIWLSSSNVLVDRGIASAGEYGVFGPERVWLIEGHGVDPDIVVDNLPHATFQGKDAQLEAAVKHLQELIAKGPVEVPKPPAYPDKKKK